MAAGTDTTVVHTAADLCDAVLPCPQDVCVFESEAYGTVLLLDGEISSDDLCALVV